MRCRNAAKSFLYNGAGQTPASAKHPRSAGAYLPLKTRQVQICCQACEFESTSWCIRLAPSIGIVHKNDPPAAVIAPVPFCTRTDHHRNSSSVLFRKHMLATPPPPPPTPFGHGHGGFISNTTCSASTDVIALQLRFVHPRSLHLLCYDSFLLLTFIVLRFMHSLHCIPVRTWFLFGTLFCRSRAS